MEEAWCLVGWWAAVIRRGHGIAPDILIRGGEAPQWAGQGKVRLGAG